MDADLSHPPEAIPRMLDELGKESDFVVGSRYTEGGVTDDNWGLFRWLNSRVATLLARPFTSIKDPMSGFFALRRVTYSKADYLNPIGYKIGLELLVKCHCQRISEVPIAFADRIHGESKLSLQEQLRYLQHIRRLFLHKYGTWSEVVQFIVVGASGVLVNLVGVTALLRAGLSASVSIAGAIVMSICTNFLLNRRFTFSHSRSGHMPTQFLSYVVSVSFGALVNYLVAILLLDFSPRLIPQLASLGGITVATIVNFVALKFIVFKRKHYRPRGSDGNG
jgi:dolichol-phosphate mannosyltransferase